MRILFVSGVDVGGAPKSTLELAKGLGTRGHEVGVVLGSSTSPEWLYTVLLKAAIKLRQTTGWTWPRELLRPFGADRAPGKDEESVTVWHRRHPANALRHLLRTFQPDVVVANSLPRELLLWMNSDARQAHVPLGLYMREEHSVTHLTVSGLRLELVLANSEHLVTSAHNAGHPCVFVPSIVDLSAAEVTSSRRVVTLVNPVLENRPEILRDLASRRPDITCVLQESWPLDQSLRTELESWTTGLPNLSLRPRQVGPADVYRDARMIVAPYPGGRPRVVLEAQHNGIPVIALAQPALIEAVSDGGVLVPLGASTSDWVETIEAVWDDVERYGALCEQALRHAGRDEVDPEGIITRFEQALKAVIS